jgi:RNA polymerase sigma-70 factor (ECF subfamily)
VVRLIVCTRAGRWHHEVHVRRPNGHAMTTSDSELIDATLRGDRDAYGHLVRRYQDRLFNSMVHTVRCQAEAEDIVQEAFVRAYTKLGTFQGNSSFLTWLYRIAMNVAVTRRRRTHATMSLDVWARSGGPQDRSEQPCEELDRRERMAQIQAALAKLDQDQRAVLVLRAIDGWDYQTIAQVLGVNIGTVRSRLHRARRKLRQYLGPLV